MSEPVVIVEYNPDWPDMFEAEKTRLHGAIGVWAAAIEHIGSTAVPGLAAKPIIDIMVGLNQLADAAFCIERMERLGYTYHPEKEDELPERRYFKRGPNTYHVHMVELGSAFWERHLLFRDYLRGHRNDALAYEMLKRELAQMHPHDRERYTLGKTRLIQEIEAKARAWKDRMGS